MPNFDSIVFEYRNSSNVWVDFSTDVLANPAPHCDGMGIMSTSAFDRVGNVGTLSFSVDNSQSGSLGLKGYSGSGTTTFTTGTPVRVYFVYDGIRRYKYFGYVEKGGVRTVTGLYRERRVDVRCINFMGIASDHTLDLIGYQTNKTMNEGVQLVINNMARQPQAYNYQTGSLYSQTFPTLFDVTRTTTKAIGEFEKLANSEWGRVYITADGQTGERLVTEGQYTRSDYAALRDSQPIPVHSSLVTDALLLVNGTDNLLLMAGGNLKLNNVQDANFGDSDISDMTVSYSDDKTVNRLEVSLNPRTVDAASTNVLWTLDEPIELAAGEEKTDVRGTYRDPDNLDTKINGIEMTTPVRTTDWQAFQNSDGTGTNYTSSVDVVAVFGTADVSYTIKNNAASTVFVTLLQARGKGVRIYNTNPLIYNNATRQNQFGVLTQSIDMPYTATVDAVKNALYPGAATNPLLSGGAFFEYTTDYAKIEEAVIIANKSTKAMMAFMVVEPGMSMIMNETMALASSNAGWYVNGYSWTLKPGKIIEWRVTFTTRTPI